MKKEERGEAINIRKKKGWSINKIAKHLGVAKSTVSLWVRDLEIDKKHRGVLDRRLKFDKDLALKLYNDGMPYRDIAEQIGISKTSLISWLGRNGHRRKRQSFPECRLCGKTNDKTHKKYCSKCSTSLRRYVNKMKAVEFLGGKCFDCGKKFKEHEFAAYEFHHKNPNDKDFQIGQLSILKWERVEKEIHKCELLCSNCHRIKHSNWNNNKMVKLAKSIVRHIK